MKNYFEVENVEVVELMSYKFKKMHIDCDRLIAVAKEDDKMATAIKGSVIAGTKGSTVDYYRKCESCGYTSSSKYNTAHLANVYRHSFRCPKCGNKQDIEIRA